MVDIWPWMPLGAASAHTQASTALIRYYKLALLYLEDLSPRLQHQSSHHHSSTISHHRSHSKPPKNLCYRFSFAIAIFRSPESNPNLNMPSSRQPYSIKQYIKSTDDSVSSANLRGSSGASVAAAQTALSAFNNSFPNQGPHTAPTNHS
jgi:hypothetical protein